MKNFKLILLSINFSEFTFKENYLPVDSHTDIINLGPTGQSTQNALGCRITDYQNIMIAYH